MKNSNHFFVTGTDTEIGKTFVSTFLCLKYKLNYLKPIQTGTNFDDDAVFIKKKIEKFKHQKLISHQDDIKIYNNIYSFNEPLSPLACTIFEKKEIDVNFLLKETQKIIDEDKNLLIEGAGGLFVPITQKLNQNFMMIDFIAQLKIPTIVVCEDKLGCLNHLFLTIEALLIRKIEISMIVLNKVKTKTPYSNFAIISNFIKSKNLFIEILSIPYLDNDFDILDLFHNSKK